MKKLDSIVGYVRRGKQSFIGVNLFKILIHGWKQSNLIFRKCTRFWNFRKLIPPKISRYMVFVLMQRITKLLGTNNTQSKVYQHLLVLHTHTHAHMRTHVRTHAHAHTHARTHMDAWKYADTCVCFEPWTTCQQTIAGSQNLDWVSFSLLYKKKKRATRRSQKYKTSNRTFTHKSYK